MIRTLRHTAPFLAALFAPVLMNSHAQAQDAAPPLESIRNYTWISDQLASAGQIAYPQIPLLPSAGYEVVVNLAIADEARNGQEGFLVASNGLTYVHIPVDWEHPELRDVEMFFDVMQANEGRKVFVHCFANMRASAFVYLYRTLVEGVPEDEARAVMSRVWDPGTVPQWGALIEQAQAELKRR
jgi:protein tyrosine phosphatase (PTP) superfamily phosphohydrolase (DUF442 family)